MLSKKRTPRESLEALQKRVDAVKGLPIREALKALGIPAYPKQWPWSKALCRMNLHDRDAVPGAAHGEVHIGCLRPDCGRILIF